MTDIKKRTWRLYPLLAPQLEALGIAHCSRNEQRRYNANTTSNLMQHFKRQENVRKC